MAVNVNFNGRLGADAELKTDKNGRQFVAYNVATDEYRNHQRETAWLSVIDYSEQAKRMAEYLKKGTMVNVHGVETVSTYQNSKGEIAINRHVMSDRTDFVSSGASSNSEANTTTVTNNSGNNVTTESRVASDASSMQCGTFQNPQQPTVAANLVPNMAGVTSTDDADDLPF